MQEDDFFVIVALTSPQVFTNAKIFNNAYHGASTTVQAGSAQSNMFIFKVKNESDGAWLLFVPVNYVRQLGQYSTAMLFQLPAWNVGLLVFCESASPVSMESFQGSEVSCRYITVSSFVSIPQPDGSAKYADDRKLMLDIKLTDGLALAFRDGMLGKSAIFTALHVKLVGDRLCASSTMSTKVLFEDAFRKSQPFAALEAAVAEFDGEASFIEVQYGTAT